MQQPQDKNTPFQIITRFTQFVKQANRCEATRRFSDEEILLLAPLEAAANDLRCADVKKIQRAKKFLSKPSILMPEGIEATRFLRAAIELLLIEAKKRQQNPELYDFLYSDTLWYYHNRDKFPNELDQEIQHYLTFENPYQSPEEDRKKDKEFEEIAAYWEKEVLSVKEFIREKILQMPDYERRDFLSSRKTQKWVTKWHEEYTKTQSHVSMRSFQNRVSEIKKQIKKQLNQETNQETA